MSVSFEWTVSSTSPAVTTVPITPAALSGLTAFRDWALDPLTGDLELVEGDFPVAAGIDGIVSDLKARLQTWVGEWFLDPTIGVDYLGRVLGRNGRLLAESELRARILETPGVTGIEAFGLAVADRIMSVAFRVATDLGQLITATLNVVQGGA